MICYDHSETSLRLGETHPPGGYVRKIGWVFTEIETGDGPLVTVPNVAPALFGRGICTSLSNVPTVLPPCPRALFGSIFSCAISWQNSG